MLELQEVDFLVLQLKKEQEFLIYHRRQILHKNLFLELRSFYHYHHLLMLYLVLTNLNLKLEVHLVFFLMHHFLQLLN